MSCIFFFFKPFVLRALVSLEFLVAMKYCIAVLLLLIAWTNGALTFSSIEDDFSEENFHRIKRQFGTNIGGLNAQGGGSYYSGGRDWGNSLRKFQNNNRNQNSDEIHASREKNYG